MVTLESDVLHRFPRFSLYNSPYVAHREGRAIDLYPATNVAPSPVAGTVESTKTTGCPSRPHAVENDHLVVIDTGERLARILHVDPAVEPGDSVVVGDPLGSMIRSGYFAPWVDNHVHLGFRAYGDDPVRARGSLPIEVDVPIAGTTWNGTGTVVEAGDTHAILDGPSHPMPGETFVGITDDSGQFVLDGGLSHYENGGILPVDAGWDREPAELLANGDTSTEPIAFLGTSLGSPTGRNLRWQAVRVLANGTAVTGISFFFGLETIYAKLVCPEVSFEEGTTVEVSLSTK